MLHGLRRWRCPTKSYSFYRRPLSSTVVSHTEEGDNVKNTEESEMMERGTREALELPPRQHSPSSLRTVFNYWLRRSDSIPENAMKLLALHGAPDEFASPLVSKWLKQQFSGGSKHVGVAKHLASSIHKTDKLALQLRLFFQSDEDAQASDLVGIFQTHGPVAPEAPDYAILLQALMLSCQSESDDILDTVIKRTFIQMKSRGIKPNDVCYTTALSFYAESAARFDAGFIDLWKDMIANEVAPNSECLALGVTAALTKNDVQQARTFFKQLFALEKQMGGKCAVTGGAALKFLAYYKALIRKGDQAGSASSVAAAENLFHTVEFFVPTESKNQLTTALMDIFVMTKRHQKVDELVKRRGNAPSRWSDEQALLIKSWISAGKHSDVIKLVQQKPKYPLFRTALDGWAREGEIGWQQIELMCNSIGQKIQYDINAYNAILTAAVNASPDAALERCDRVWKRLGADSQNQPNPITYNLMITAAYRSRRPEVAQATLQNFTPDVRTFSAMLGYEAEYGDMEAAEQMLLREMPRAGLQPNVHSYLVVLQGWLRKKNPDRMYRLYETMLENSITPSRETHKVLVWGLSEHDSHVAQADKVLETIEAKNEVPHRLCYIGVFRGYCRVRRPDAATRLLIRQIKSAGKDETMFPPPGTIHQLIRAWIENDDLVAATGVLVRMDDLYSRNLLPAGPDVGTIGFVLKHWAEKSEWSPQQKHPYLKQLFKIKQRMENLQRRDTGKDRMETLEDQQSGVPGRKETSDAVGSVQPPAEDKPDSENTTKVS